MSRSTKLIKALTADDAGNVLAAVTPALDDNTKALATTEFLRQQFTGAGKQNLATPGYQKLPGGLIIQWGQTVTSGSAGVAVAFPVQFPNAVRAVTMAPLQGSSVSATYDTVTTSGMVINGWNPATGARASFNAVGWIAIGN